MKKNRIHILQPALPHYRQEFFEILFKNIKNNYYMTVYYSDTDMGKLSQSDKNIYWTRNLGQQKHFLNKIFWQNTNDIRLSRGDILVIFGNPRYLSNLYMLVKAKIFGVKIIWWSHLWSASSSNFGFKVRLYLMSISDLIMLYTETEATHYQSLMEKSIFQRRAIGLNNGLNTIQINKFRKAYSASRRSKSLVFIGRLTQKANIFLLIDALAMLDHQDVSLNIIGNETHDQVLENYISEKNLSHRVRCYGQLTDEENISQVMNSSRLFVYPGAIGLSLLHSMSYGLPGIIHDDRNDHMPEHSAFVAPNMGDVFKKGSAASLAKSINGLIDDTQRLDHLSENCLALVEETYNSADMCKRFIDAVAKVSQ